jgi:hypothetical protein
MIFSKKKKKKITELTVDDPKSINVGWFIKENVGIAVCNPRAIILLNEKKNNAHSR